MKAIEFEAIPHHHSIRLPEQIPDGVKLRVLVLLEDEAEISAKKTGKKRNCPSPKLAGSIRMLDDLIQPAVPESDWNTLK
jgi:hypothetical protein